METYALQFAASYGKGFDTQTLEVAARSLSFCRISRLLVVVFIGFRPGLFTSLAPFSNLSFCSGATESKCVSRFSRPPASSSNCALQAPPTNLARPWAAVMSLALYRLVLSIAACMLRSSPGVLLFEERDVIRLVSDFVAVRADPARLQLSDASRPSGRVAYKG